jgi:hypothetical protein
MAPPPWRSSTDQKRPGCSVPTAFAAVCWDKKKGRDGGMDGGGMDAGGADAGGDLP